MVHQQYIILLIKMASIDVYSNTDINTVYRQKQNPKHEEAVSWGWGWMKARNLLELVF